MHRYALGMQPSPLTRAALGSNPLGLKPKPFLFLFVVSENLKYGYFKVFKTTLLKSVASLNKKEFWVPGCFNICSKMLIGCTLHG
jgi:hypothetical protein